LLSTARLLLIQHCMTPIVPELHSGDADRAVEPTLLIPLPGPYESLDDVEVLSAWYEALSNIIGIEVPHDLLALWVFTPRGAQLIGPASLAEDDLRVPLPDPRVSGPQLLLLADVLVHAGYRSAVARPVRVGRRDVGLMLYGAFAPDIWEAATIDDMDRIARHIAPVLARLAEPERAHDVRADEQRALERIGRAVCRALSPRAFAAEVGASLGQLMPVERLELLVTGGANEQAYRLDDHDGGSLWSRASLIVPREVLDPVAIIGDADAIVVQDAMADTRWRSWAADGVRSVLATRLVVAEKLVGHLLIACAEAGVYDGEDARRLALVAPWIAARVDGIVQGYQLRGLRAQLGSANSVPVQLRRMATVLATTSDLGTGLRDYMSEATALLPFHRVRIALRTGDEQVVMVVPGETKSLAELSSAPIGAGVVGRVLEGEAPHGVMGGGLEVELVFPLRVANAVTGALIITTGTPEAFTKNHLALAQQVADGVGLYLEHMRREAGHEASLRGGPAGADAAIP
jgi:GAF domain-containing protein